MLDLLVDDGALCLIDRRRGRASRCGAYHKAVQPRRRLASRDRVDYAPRARASARRGAVARALHARARPPPRAPAAGGMGVGSRR